MIVRGAVMSEKRVVLEGAPASERAYLAPVRSAPSVVREAESVTASATTGVSAGPSASAGLGVSAGLGPPGGPASVVALAPTPPAAPPPLTLEAVSKWLATQDEATCAALAKQLAEEIDDIKRAAHEQGLAAGLKAGQAEAEAAAERHLDTLASLNKSAQTALESEAASLGAQCAEIVGAALTRLAGPLLATPDAAVGAVIEVLKRLTEEREVVVRVSAADLPAVEAASGHIAAALAGRKYSVVADKRVEAGGALVETNLGTLDGRLEIQLRGLAETVIAAKAAQRSGRE